MKNSRSPLFTIFLTVFIDMLGVGIIIPVLPALFFEPETSIVPLTMSESERAFLFGALLGVFPLMQFFGAPMLGSLSDRYGRKPVLHVTQAGTLLGYLLLAVAILWQNIPLLFISRMIPGFTGGNIAVILSSIADVSDDKDKARNFGQVGMAFGIGYIQGPTLGGVLADESIVSWLTASTPFWFTAILTAFNVLFIIYAFPETLKQRRTVAVNPFTGFRNLALSFGTPNLRRIFIVVLLLSLGFTFFTQFYSVYLIQDFSYSEKDIGFLFGWVGIWLALTQGVLVRFLGKRFPPQRILTYSILALSASLVFVMLPDTTLGLYMLNPLIAVAQGITSPNLTATISMQANEDQQGEILGINQSMQSLGQLIPSLVGGYLITFFSSLPIIVGSGLVLAGWIVFIIFFGRQKEKS